MTYAVRLHDERAAFLSLEALIWRDGPVCPHCGESSRLGRLSGSSCSIGTWKCYACRKPFTVRHGTIFQNSHVPMHVWLQGLYLLMSSGHRLSSQKLGQILGISVRTAWHLKGKIAAALTARESSSGVPPADTWPPLDIRRPLPEAAAPPQPGQAIYRARYERFLNALDNLASPCSDAVFFDALNRLLAFSASRPGPRFEASGEQQLQLSLFDDPELQMGCCGQNDARF
ncbi:MAG: transposase [Bosea sp.]|uniref:IS1595 family transposase n=1 Tax=Bosea sp. (in: a-proteobacteria) TaxID=1871050 RepID=UPI001ACE4E49|nr:IS1595 family transposase [Bosea sp. (in: a-proteobacteria)]MBN9453387.1 transposase [Bosea sp. (in: a-proteobacteria)]